MINVRNRQAEARAGVETMDQTNRSATRALHTLCSAHCKTGILPGVRPYYSNRSTVTIEYLHTSLTWYYSIIYNTYSYDEFNYHIVSRPTYVICTVDSRVLMYEICTDKSILK